MRVSLSIFFVLFLAVAGSALDAPKGPGVVTFKGLITQKNRGDTAVLDAAMLDKLKTYTVKTVTPWYTGAQTFDGPSLADVLKLVGATGKTLKIIALNDYAIDVPLEDAALYSPILARRIGGVALTPRDKGPLFLVYPYDSKPELSTEKFYARSAWQIAVIEVL